MSALGEQSLAVARQNRTLPTLLAHAAVPPSELEASRLFLARKPKPRGHD
jgi:hypothetical protein